MNSVRALAWAALVVLAVAGLLVFGWIGLALVAVFYAGAELATGQLWSDDQGWWARAASLLGWAAVLVATVVGLFSIGWVTLPAVAVLVVAGGELHTARGQRTAYRRHAVRAAD